MKLQLIAIAICAVFATSACSSTNQWTRSNTDAAHFQRDKEQCLHDIKVPANIDTAKAKSMIELGLPGCMRSKGYAPAR